MIIDPYQSTRLQMVSTKEIIREITSAFIRGELITHESNRNLILITDKNKSIPLFSQPIIFERGDKNVAIDIRPYSKFDRAGKLIISAKDDMDVHLLQGLLTLDAVKHNGYANFLTFKASAMKIFVNWIVRRLSRNLALDFAAQIRLTIITAIYFFELFRTAEEKDDVLTRDALVIYRTLRIPANEVTELMQEAKQMENLKDYCEVVKELGSSPRFNELNPLFIYNLLSSGWFGFQSQETINVALEHPPTFIAMVYKASTERSYQRTEIGKLVEEVMRNDTTLVAGVENIIKKR